LSKYRKDAATLQVVNIWVNYPYCHMHYRTTDCGGNGGRSPRIQIRQHMLHVNGHIHLASALIPGHNLMRHKQRSHSSARTELYCTMKMEVAGYYETFVLDYQTALLYHGGQKSFL
jgi:hypothetical protein